MKPDIKLSAHQWCATREYREWRGPTEKDRVLARYFNTSPRFTPSGALDAITARLADIAKGKT